MNEEELYYVDVDSSRCTLCKDNILHLSQECYSEGFKEDVTGKIMRLFYKQKQHANAFAKLYALHHIPSSADDGEKPKDTKKK